MALFAEAISDLLKLRDSNMPLGFVVGEGSAVV